MLLSDWYAKWKQKHLEAAVEEAKAKDYQKGYADGRYDEIIFSPDPRKPYTGSIGRENDDTRYSRISIQLGSNGTFGKDGSHSAFLERREDGFYQLLLANLDEGHSEPWRVFSDTYNVNTVCDQVEQLFEDGHLQVHFVEGEKKPILQGN